VEQHWSGILQENVIIADTINLKTMKIHRDINGIQMSFDITDKEVVQWVASKTMDERIVFFRKLAQLDIKSFDIFNLLKSDKK
jgi:hypothetical protein